MAKEYRVTGIPDNISELLEKEAAIELRSPVQHIAVIVAKHYKRKRRKLTNS